MLRKVKYSNEKKIKVAELEISRFQVEFEIEPYYLMHYAVDFLKVNDDVQLNCFEFKILIETQKWQIAIKEKFDKLLTSSKNPNLTKRLFDDLPTMLSEKVMATHVFILNNLGQDNWKELIIDYLDYVVDSFGKVPNPFTVPAGLNEYLKYLLTIHDKFDWGNYTKGVIDRLVFILNYITTTYVKDEVERKKFEMLLEVYDKWYHVFPFDIKLFSDVKDSYSHTLPILKKKPRINPYLGTEVYMFYSENEMLDFLLSITKKTLSSFKSKELVKPRTEYIRNDTKFNLELVNKLHWLDQKDLLTKFSSGQTSYINVVKKWLSTETRYLKKVLKNYNLNSEYQSFEIRLSRDKWEYDNLKDFKESLYDKGFIASISTSSFNRIFSGKIINNKVIWKTTPTDLAYLINRLIKIKVYKLDVKSSKVKLLYPTTQKHWDIAARCFKKPDGTHFSPSDFRKLDPPRETVRIDLDLALNKLV